MTIRHGIIALALGALAATPAAATRTVTYTGTADFDSFSTLGPVAGLVDGPASFTASFYYDDALELISATTRVGGVLRGTFRCPVVVGLCAALGSTPANINSQVFTTPEDGLSMSVSPLGGFAVDFLAPHRVTYDVLPGDYGAAFVTWAAYDGPAGFAYSSGGGTIDRVEAAVPEPGTWALMIGGFAAVGLASRRRRATIDPETAPR